MRPNLFVDNKDLKAVWKSANLSFRNWLEYPQWCSVCDQEIVLLEAHMELPRAGVVARWQHCLELHASSSSGHAAHFNFRKHLRDSSDRCSESREELLRRNPKSKGENFPLDTPYFFTLPCLPPPRFFFFTPHRKPSTPQGEGEFDRKAPQESSPEETLIQRKKLSPGHPIFLHAPLSSSFTLLLRHSLSQNPPHHEGKEELDRKAAARKK